MGRKTSGEEEKMDKYESTLGTKRRTGRRNGVSRNEQKRKALGSYKRSGGERHHCEGDKRGGRHFRGNVSHQPGARVGREKKGSSGEALWAYPGGSRGTRTEWKWRGGEKAETGDTTGKGLVGTSPIRSWPMLWSKEKTIPRQGKQEGLWGVTH